MYHEFNEKYFGGRCPNIEVYTEDLSKTKVDREKERYGYTAISCKTNRVKFIALNSRIAKWKDASLITLLHEMVHARYPRSEDHGPLFKKERRRLIVAGAFDELI